MSIVQSLPKDIREEIERELLLLRVMSAKESTTIRAPSSSPSLSSLTYGVISAAAAAGTSSTTTLTSRRRRVDNDDNIRSSHNASKIQKMEKKKKKMVMTTTTTTTPRTNSSSTNMPLIRRVKKKKKYTTTRSYEFDEILNQEENEKKEYQYYRQAKEESSQIQQQVEGGDGCGGVLLPTTTTETVVVVEVLCYQCRRRCSNYDDSSKNNIVHRTKRQQTLNSYFHVSNIDERAAELHRGLEGDATTSIDRATNNSAGIIGATGNDDTAASPCTATAACGSCDEGPHEYGTRHKHNNNNNLDTSICANGVADITAAADATDGDSNRRRDDFVMDTAEKTSTISSSNGATGNTCTSVYASAAADGAASSVPDDDFATLTKSTTKGKRKRTNNTDDSRMIFCAHCRLPLRQQQSRSSSSTGSAPKYNKIVTKLPQITRLNGYKKLAKDANLPFTLTDKEAFDIMRQPCFGCGYINTDNGNGITRLKNWDRCTTDEQRQKVKRKGGYMGPFTLSNCKSACSTCNLMKGSRSIESYIEACRTIATHRGLDYDEKDYGLGGGRSRVRSEGAMEDMPNNKPTMTRRKVDNESKKDYGTYPNRFRNNISKRCRSSYITKSSTHTKTHCLTNEQFNLIVSMPCYYCGKISIPPTHYNGLDRVNNEDRVYHLSNVVSCCGDCNIMKYKHPIHKFLQHCVNVSEYHIDTVTNTDTGKDAETNESNKNINHHEDGKPESGAPRISTASNQDDRKACS